MSAFTEMMMANAIQVDAGAQLLVEKGTIQEDEFYTKMKQVQADYQRKGLWKKD